MNVFDIPMCDTCGHHHHQGKSLIYLYIYIYIYILNKTKLIIKKIFYLI